MAMMRFAVLSLLICFLAGVTHAEKERRENEEREKKKPDVSTGSDYKDYKPPGGWPDISGHPIPSSLPAGVSWGPFIPLGMPLPQTFPSFPSAPLDGSPMPEHHPPSYFDLAFPGMNAFDSILNENDKPDISQEREELAE